MFIRFSLKDYKAGRYRIGLTPHVDKVAISLPQLVTETNSFSVKNRPGCTATLKNSNPADLFLEYNVKCNLPDSDPAGHDVRVHFDVSKVEETEKAKDLDVKVSCACPAFLYWGGQWNLHQRDGLEGEARPLLQAPTERLDLRSNFVICKHCKAVFERILPAVQNNINNILRKLRVKQYEEEVKEKGIEPPSIRRQLAPKDEEVAQKLREGIEQREREKLLKDQGLVKRTPEVVTVAPQKPLAEPLEELEPYMPDREFKELQSLEEGERQRLLRELPPPPPPEEATEEEHPGEPHLHKGLPYKREEPKWKQWVNKLKNRLQQWKTEEKPPYRKFTSKRKKSMVTLADVLPSEFRLEHMESRAAKLYNVGVLHEFNSQDNPWPGPEKNVGTWWELVNGYVVGWNESPTRGWSFPVRKSKKASQYSTEETAAIEQQLRDANFVNPTLRGSGKLSPQQLAHASVLDEIIENCPPLTKSIIVYRATALAPLLGEGAHSQKATNGLNVGSTFVDKGYVSTTTNKASADNPGYSHENDRILLNITVPPGTRIFEPNKAGLTGKAGELAGWENEVLLPRDSTFRIDKVINERELKVTLI